MTQNHLSRIAAPKSWQLARKGNKWITRPRPGAHALLKSMSASFVLREILEHCKTSKEIKKVLNENNFSVDKKIRKEHNFSVGLMDVIEIPKLNEIYRVLYDKKGKFYLLPIKNDESNLKLLKVIRKTAVKNGKIQVTFHDGKNILLDKFTGHVGDSALFDLSKKSVVKWLPIENGSVVYLSGGKHTGQLGKIKDVIRAKNLEKPKVVVDIDGAEYTTLMDYAFVAGKKESELKLEDKNEGN